MHSKFTKLFEPGCIGKLQLRNRVVMAPMGTNFAGLDGRYSQRQIDYYAERARGGVGLVITGTHKVENQIEHLEVTRPRADADNLIASMSDLVDAVHDNGAKIAIQLTAGQGRVVGFADPKAPPVSASAIPFFANPAVICRPLTFADIGTYVEAFGAAARRAYIAGFDAIEIHGHAGYLIDQFLSAGWNQRTDEYGGDLDRRLRFPTEIVEAIRKVVGPDFPISFRFSVDQKIPGGRGIEEAQGIARRLEAIGVNVIHADAGCYESIEWIFPTNYLGDACMLDMAEAIKKVVNIPVIAVGNMTPEEGEAALEAGKADFIAFGRGLTADPHLPNKVRRGQRAEVRPCVRCNDRCVGRLTALKTVSCTVNASVGNERNLQLRRTETPRRVLVIGGGPAGLEAARIAALRGHQVMLLEKGPVLGGTLTAIATPSFKQELHQLVEWWKLQMCKLEVDVHLNALVTADSPKLEWADAIVAATGGGPIMPAISGIEGDNVVEVRDYHLDQKPIQGERVVIAGGGLSGCDAGLELAMKGKAVTIVEMLDGVARDLNVVSRLSLLRRLEEHGVRVMTRHQVKEFRATGLIAKGPDGLEVAIEADTVVVAFGMQPDDTLARAIQSKWPEVYVIGDCVKPGKVCEAVRAGFAVGWQID